MPKAQLASKMEDWQHMWSEITMVPGRFQLELSTDHQCPMIIVDPQNCPLFTAGDNTQLRELLHPTRQPLALRYSLAHATLAAGETSLSHRLRSSEVYYILSGTGVMHVEGETRKVGAGQSVYIPPGATQFISNTGSGDLQFLCIVDPAWRAEDEEVNVPDA